MKVPPDGSIVAGTRVMFWDDIDGMVESRRMAGRLGATDAARLGIRASTASVVDTDCQEQFCSCRWR